MSNADKIIRFINIAVALFSITFIALLGSAYMYDNHKPSKTSDSQDNAGRWGCPEWKEEISDTYQLTPGVYVERVGVFCTHQTSDEIVDKLSEARWVTFHLNIYRSFGPFKYKVETIGHTEGREYDSDDVYALDIPDGDDSTFAVVTVAYSASNVWVELLAYESTLFSITQLDKAKDPLTKYQTTNRQGSGKEVDGFYKVSEHHLYLDILVPVETEEFVCNACREYEVVTLEFFDKTFSEVARKPFDIEAYQR